MKRTAKFIALLAVIFAAAVAAIFFIRRDDSAEEPVYSSMESASLPLISMYFGDETVNTLHGHTASMDIATMRDTLTPLGDDNTLTMKLTTYGSSVSNMSYSLYDASGSTLLESGSMRGYKSITDSGDLSLTLGTELEDDTEYILVITLSTDKWDSVDYYTRVRYYSDTYLEELLEFALEFSELTMTQSDVTAITNQMETDSSADNSSLAYVTLASSYSLMTWADLDPTLAGERSIDIKELNERTATIVLTYQVTADDGDGGTDTYNVTESMGVRYSDGTIWIIAYERTMEQVFGAEYIDASDGQIDLGILSADDLPVEAEGNDSYIVFEADGELWEYALLEDAVYQVFSFKDEDGNDDARTLYDQFEYQIIDLTDDGVVTFIVYGYMDRGSHEGETGIAFCEFDPAQNVLTEKIFIRYAGSFEYLKKAVGSLSYMDDSEIFYIMLGDCIYAVDITGGEYVEAVTGIEDGCYVVSPDSDAVAWTQESLSEGSDTINVFFADGGITLSVEAPEDSLICPLGFIDGDLVYGIAYASSVGVTGVSFPMYAIEIVDVNGELLAHYEDSGIYISEAEIGTDRISLTRVTIGEDGTVTAAEDDTLIMNAAVEEDTVAVEEEYDSIRLTTYSLTVESDEELSAEPSIMETALIDSSGSRQITLPSDTVSSGYIAYSYGSLAGVYETVAEAVEAVYDTMGVVLGTDMGFVWTRANRAWSASLEYTAITAASEDDSLAACLQIMLGMIGADASAADDLANGLTAAEVLDKYTNGGALDITGLDITEILYYLDAGCPVLAVCDGSAQLLVGYDMYNDIIIYDPLKGAAYVVTEETAEAMYSAYGYPFTTYLP